MREKKLFSNGKRLIDTTGLPGGWAFAGTFVVETRAIGNIIPRKIIFNGNGTGDPRKNS
jgi:hypothetical protein